MNVAELIETQLLRERVTELAEANDALERERDAIQRGWNDDRRRSDEAIDAHMARWKRAEAELAAAQARAEAVESAAITVLECIDDPLFLHADALKRSPHVKELRAALAAAPEARDE